MDQSFIQHTDFSTEDITVAVEKFRLIYSSFFMTLCF
jgi:hypothetical protein